MVMPVRLGLHPIFYSSLPAFCCGTIGFNYRSEYVIDALIKNGSRKAYQLILIFNDSRRIGFFRRQLFLRLKDRAWLKNSEIKAMEKKSYIEYGDDRYVRLSKIYMFSSTNKRIMEKGLRGIGREFTIIQMNCFIYGKFRYIINKFKRNG